MLLERLQQAFLDSVTAVYSADSPEVVAAAQSLHWERPKNASFGDYAINVSPLSRPLKQAPPAIAQQVLQPLADHLVGLVEHPLTVVGGFINVRLTSEALTQALHAGLQANSLVENTALTGQRFLLEYVSANPTGPLHIGHGRWAALGDSLARIWRASGAQVDTEFYINDAGVQIEKILHSVMFRIIEQLQAADTVAAGENPWTCHYPGEYVSTIAQAFLTVPEQYDWAKSIVGHAPEALTRDALAPLETVVIPAVRAQQEALLAKLGVTFDRWYSEKAELHQADADGATPITRALAVLEERGWLKTEDDALWLCATRAGDEKDRVLRKKDGEYTYLSADIAYHHEKFTRPQNYTHVVNIWGADHHGYIPRMKAALVALGHLTDPTDARFEVLLGQLVNLIVDGEKTRMGKRRQMLTLDDMVDEVGTDAVRFWMVSKAADTALDFNVDLALSTASENPVFYAQYAHARTAGILRTVQAAFPALTEAALAQTSSDTLASLWDALESDEARHAARQLLLHLNQASHWVANAAKHRAPHNIARYVLETASLFHAFYTHCRVLTDTPAITHPRLALVLLTQRTLAQTLDLLGVTAPYQM